MNEQSVAGDYEGRRSRPRFVPMRPCLGQVDIVFLDDSWINRRGTARRAPTTPDLGVLPISDTFPWSPQIPGGRL